MDIPTNYLDKFKEDNKGKPPHYLSDYAQRMCDKLGIPFNTVLLRLLKTNPTKTERLVQYMSERGIKSTHYLTKAFYAK